MIQLAQYVIGYVEAKFDLATATGYRKLMRVLAGLCWLIIAITIGMFTLLFLTAAVGLAIGSWLNSRALGVFFMGATYSAILFGLFKKRRSIVKYFFNLLDSAVEKEERPDEAPVSQELLPVQP